MATLADFTVAASGFPLGRVFEHLPDATIELERVVPTRDHILPYLWVRDASGEDVLDAIATHDALEDASIVDELADSVLIRAEWVETSGGLIGWFVRADVTLLSAVGTATEWTFEVRVEDTDVLSELQAYCSANDVPLELRRLRSLADVLPADEYGLTAAQETALLLAYDEGYYSEPRETTLEELADRLGITRQSLSARLRRGYENLIGATLTRRRR